MSAPQVRGRGYHNRPQGRGGFRPSRGGNRAPGGHLPRQEALSTQASTPFDSGVTTPADVEDVRRKFSEFSGLGPELLSKIPFEFCTEVQGATLPTILEDHDVLAQAKTGTGKTLAFLIPSIQRLISSNPTPPQHLTSILVLSPTRELAIQIGEAAEKLLGGKDGRFGVKCVVGGTNMDRDIKELRSQRADVLVATPGRLVDLLQNGGLKPRLAQLRTLVLDEADRLLDAGFRRELMQILESLPDRTKSPRQTLLFSATIPKEVHKIASLALQPNHKFITTLTEEDVNVHEHVRQESLVVPGGDILSAALEVLLEEEQKGKDGSGFKVMVFLPTARAAGLFHELFSSMPIDFPVWEIHSRMSQPKRVKATDAFREAERGVLFSSDVTARGIDVKGVTAVVQIGLPSSAEQYVHRLGRTARAGASGHGILILGDYETFFLNNREMQSFNLHPYPALDPSSPARDMINQGLEAVSDESKAQAYQAWLGYYNSNLRNLKWDQNDLVRNANDYARYTLRYQGDAAHGGEWKPPGLFAKTVGKMQLKGVKGLNVVKEPPRDGNGRGGGGGGGRAGPSDGAQLGKRGREEGGQSVRGGFGDGRDQINGSQRGRGGFGGGRGGGGGGGTRGGGGGRGRGGRGRGGM